MVSDIQMPLVKGRLWNKSSDNHQILSQKTNEGPLIGNTHNTNIVPQDLRYIQPCSQIKHLRSKGTLLDGVMLIIVPNNWIPVEIN